MAVGDNTGEFYLSKVIYIDTADESSGQWAVKEPRLFHRVRFSMRFLNW